MEFTVNFKGLQIMVFLKRTPGEEHSFANLFHSKSTKVGRVWFNLKLNRSGCDSYHVRRDRTLTIEPSTFEPMYDTMCRHRSDQEIKTYLEQEEAFLQNLATFSLLITPRTC